MLNIGLAREIITPPCGAGLAGYFNHRPNRGYYDDISVRAMAIEKDGKYTGFLNFDLCSLINPTFNEIRMGLRAEGISWADDIIISATHTHTGSALRRANANEPECYACVETIQAAIRAMKRAVRSFQPSEMFYAEYDKNPYAFVRRYRMKDGSVVTNPTRCNPDIVGPETDFDQHIRVIAVKQYGRIAAIMVNLANHCDTVGGDIVSADWPGRMEAEIQYGLKSSIPVFGLTDASGNINHFDVYHKIDQTNYDEAVRIGRGYGKIVLGLLDKLQPLDLGDIQISHKTDVVIPHRKVTDEQYELAKKYLEDTKDAAVTGGDLTSEGLSAGDVTVWRHFAKRVIDCREKSTPSHVCSVTRVNFGKELAFITLPGEPFNGIAQAIRKASPYKHNIVVELAQSQSSYVPMRECFGEISDKPTGAKSYAPPYGGYEAQPGTNTVAPNASDELIKASIENL